MLSEVRYSTVVQGKGEVNERSILRLTRIGGSVSAHFPRHCPSAVGELGTEGCLSHLNRNVEMGIPAAPLLIPEHYSSNSLINPCVPSSPRSFSAASRNSRLVSYPSSGIPNERFPRYAQILGRRHRFPLHPQRPLR